MFSMVQKDEEHNTGPRAAHDVQPLRSHLSSASWKGRVGATRRGKGESPPPRRRAVTEYRYPRDHATSDPPPHGQLVGHPVGSDSARTPGERSTGSKMAQRLLLRRAWTLSAKDLRPLPRCAFSSSCCSSSFSLRSSSGPASSSSSSSSRSPLLLATASRHRLPLHHTPRRAASFNVQDHDDFTERVINSDLPVLVDFHAQWCGPCKILGPRLEKAVAKQKGRIAMAKVDIDDHTDLAIEYGVSAVPTVIAIRGGSVIDQFVGIKDDDQLDSFVDKLVGQ
ncbi:unnamed protein product [Merluccius merluccius]